MDHRLRGRCRPAAGVLGVALLLLAGSPVAAQGQCMGDCDSSGGVAVSELVMMVNIALQNADMDECLAGDANGEVVPAEVGAGFDLRGSC